jgi:methyl-accepting chemotaxis protein
MKRWDISTKISLTVVAALIVLLSAMIAIVAKNSLDFAKQQRSPRRKAICGWPGK